MPVTVAELIVELRAFPPEFLVVASEEDGMGFNPLQPLTTGHYYRGTSRFGMIADPAHGLIHNAVIIAPIQFFEESAS